MRLWSLHPKYLDAKGFVALWREGLLAQKVLMGKTRGYTKHPQLIRFQKCKNPVTVIGSYLTSVANEADERGYTFDRSKINSPAPSRGRILRVTKGQLNYEFKHLLKKLKVRDQGKYKAVAGVRNVQANPLFKLVNGSIADWERVDRP